jgi:zona occludens toxin
MAIKLVTGLPGNGKTLYTISYVKKWAERENRQVYYARIPELKLPWLPIEPDKWMDAPPGSIIVIDEAQEVFRNRSLGAQPPEHVKALETHRHKGLDLVLMTQHPSLIDPAIRKLTQTHKHLVRIWGSQMSTIHEWMGVRDNCDKPVGRRDSEKTKWAFDKSVYSLYKSADLHTMKRSIPGRVKLLAIVPVLLALAGWYVYNTTLGKHKVDAPQQVAAAHVQPGARPLPVTPPAPDLVDPVQDAREFIAERVERVQGLPQTAPRYDELTKPVRVPVPAACIASSQGCKCYTQQATRLDVPYNACMSIVENGYFEDFNPNGSKEVQPNGAGYKTTPSNVSNVSGVPASPAEFAEAGNRVLNNPPPQRITSRM